MSAATGRKTYEAEKLEAALAIENHTSRPATRCESCGTKFTSRYPSRYCGNCHQTHAAKWR
jgi:uncharacterized OB-fold protein